MKGKKSMIKTDGVIFDLDGTLWDSREEIAKAWNLLIEKKGGAGRGPITSDELKECMGLPMYDIAAKLFPHLPEAERRGLMDEMGVFENDYLKIHGSPVFPGIMDLLRSLASSVPLYIVSNCQAGYIESFIFYYGLSKIFKDTECWGNTGKSKGENISMLLERNEIKSPVYIGDTDGDSKACRQAGVPFIFAKYGFGTTEDYDFSINRPKDLLDIIEI